MEISYLPARSIGDLMPHRWYSKIRASRQHILEEKNKNKMGCRNDNYRHTLFYQEIWLAALVGERLKEVNTSSGPHLRDTVGTYVFQLPRLIGLPNLLVLRKFPL